jgi:hypothetical protein
MGNLAAASVAVMALLAVSAVPAPCGDPQRELDALERRFETTTLPWMESYEKFLPEYEAFAKRYPGTEQALAARLRVLQFAGRWKKEEKRMKDEAGRIVDGILADFPRSERLAALPDLWYLFHREKLDEVFRHLSDPGQPPAVRAAMLLHRARALVQNDRAAEAKPLLEEIAAKYADVPSGHSTCGEIADALANPHPPSALAVGQVAPEITGKDVDGKPIRLSDHKGKVVVIDFFGDW